jgi:hypothetical protein
MQTDFEMKHVHESFNEKELFAMHETELFRLKYILIDKVVVQFNHLSAQVKEVIQRHNLPHELANARVRIFRGDNYKLLPYAVMDYPALYARENSFAYRTMFWWGNFFSFTLYLHGTYLDMYRENLQEGVRGLTGKGFYFCVNETPWQYHYERDNYISLDEMLNQQNGDIEQLIGERDFIKLSRFIKINDWKKVNSTCIETFESLLKASGA